MEIKRFLFCFSTREGSVLCGIGTLLIGIPRIYFLWFNMAFLHRLTEKQIQDLPLSFEVISTISKVQTAVAVLTITVAIILLVGVFKERRKLLLPWISCVIFEELLDFSIIIFYIQKSAKINASVYIGDSIFMVINLYCILCVYSYYKQLKRDDLKRPLYNLRGDLDDSEDEYVITPQSHVI